MSDRFAFTLILATCGRTHEVARFFASLRSERCQSLPLQIIVADQNGDDRLVPILKSLPQAWHVEHVRSSVRGVCAARNEVLQRIDAPFVAFPDDDCIYADHTLEEALRLFESRRDVDILMGVWSGLDEPFASSGKELPPRPVSRYSLFRHGEMFVQFYRTAVVQKVGKFDEAFGPGPDSRYPFGGDDSDYLARAILSGATAVRCASLHVYHPRQDMRGFSVDKIAGYGRTRMALLRKLHYPWWFRLLNVVYPLVRILASPIRFRYYGAMFRGRFLGLCKR